MKTGSNLIKVLMPRSERRRTVSIRLAKEGAAGESKDKISAVPSMVTAMNFGS